MKKGTLFFRTTITSIFIILILSFTLIFGVGCATKGQTGALTGAGAGALIGGLVNMHGSWGATALIGAGVGAGLGYLIGNEMDKKDAQTRQQPRPDELRPLAGTSWQLVSSNPKPKEYKNVICAFQTDGYVVTTETDRRGQSHTTVEKYRIVGSTLIISKTDYVLNAGFRIEGNHLHIDYGNGSATFIRI